MINNNKKQIKTCSRIVENAMKFDRIEGAQTRK